MSEQHDQETQKHLFREVMETFNKISYLRPEDIPDIPLYMDQVTSLLDSRLDPCKRYPDDKILTKTMINNYTKNRLIPPPEKKKYSREHLIFLLYVYYLKDFLSIDDIAGILGPLEQHHFPEDDNLSVTEVYQRVIDAVSGQVESMSRDLFYKCRDAEKVFPELDGEDGQYMDTFALISFLSFDVYIKKQIIEHLIDGLSEHQDSGKKKK